jgi:hypothetical protein
MGTRTTTDGVKIHFVDEGGGPAVVLRPVPGASAFTKVNFPTPEWPRTR